jgi:uncharacterized membrane protein YqgA involved in biofilm formation
VLPPLPISGSQIRETVLYLILRAPMGLGTAINVVAVLVGGGIGTLVGAKLPGAMRHTAMQAIGIVTLLVGVQSFLRFDNALVPLVSVIAGLVVGELLGIDGRLKRFGDSLERRFSKGGSPVSRAFVTTSLLFCVGPLTILGSLQDGISGDYRLLALKSALDFIAALSFAAVLGWGVLLSAGSVLVVQGALTLAGAFFGAFMDEPMIMAMTSTGGVLLLGLGLVLLELKEVRVANMLPALVLAPLLVAAAPLWPF